MYQSLKMPHCRHYLLTFCTKSGRKPYAAPPVDNFVDKSEIGVQP